MVEEKVLYQNTTQVSNFILDNLHLFNEGQLKVALLITRKTVGWHKETDFLRYSQLISLTGLSKQTVSTAVKDLIEIGLVQRVDKQGTVLEDNLRGRREETYYTLNKDLTKEQLVQNLDKLIENKDLSKKLTSTGQKFRQYKTNSLQNSQSLSKDNGRTPGLNKIGDVLERLNLQPKGVTRTDNRIANGWQHYAHEVIKVAGIVNGERSRVFGIFKEKNYGHFHFEKTKEVITHPNYLALTSEKKRVSYLIGAWKKG